MVAFVAALAALPPSRPTREFVVEDVSAPVNIGKSPSEPALRLAIMARAFDNDPLDRKIQGASIETRPLRAHGQTSALQ
jgi:hypothetical protein